LQTSAGVAKPNIKLQKSFESANLIAMETFYTIILCVSALLFSFIGTAGIVYFKQITVGALSEKEEDDNAVSSDEVDDLAAPYHFGGAAMMFTLLGFLLIVGLNSTVLAAALFMGVFSLFVDASRVGPMLRHGGYIVLIAWATASFDGLVFQGLLPPIADKLCVGILWYAFVNMFRVMDGADEMSVMQTFMIGFGIIVLGVVEQNFLRGAVVDSAIIMASVVGFGFFNRYPAKAHLGNVASAPMGLLLGYLLLHVAAQGYVFVALILPIYYIIDTLITFLLRVSVGKSPFGEHHKYGYLRPIIKAGKTDSAVVVPAFVANGVIIACAIASLFVGKFAPLLLPVSVLVAVGLYSYYIMQAPKRSNAPPKTLAI